MNLRLEQISAWLPTSSVIGDPNTQIQRVHTDTRSLQAGDLFVALKGDRFDAHDFLPQAKQAGAAAAIAEHGIAQVGFCGIEVSDSLHALGQIGKQWRAMVREDLSPLELIAVTGSNGKTTVTQMIASILNAHYGDQALATRGNFNNEVGVPLTLLRLQPKHQAAVVELGMNHPGEIARLAAIALPSVALVNNAQREHMEFMSSVEAVAQENGSVFKSLPQQGVAIFPIDDDYASLWQHLSAHCQTITFSVNPHSPANVRLHAATWTGSAWQMQVQITQAASSAYQLDAQVAIAGEHNLHNALAAIACAVAIKVPAYKIAEGLAQFRPVQGRMQSSILHWHGRSINLIDDSYNANPDSVRAAIDMLSTQTGVRTLVLGDMGEVGNHSASFHQEIGAYAHAAGLDNLVCVGDATQATVKAFNEASALANSYKTATHFVSNQLAQHYLETQILNTTNTLLIKGSRFMKMETILQHLTQAANDLISKEANHAA